MLNQPTGLTTPTVDGKQLPNDYRKAGQLIVDALTPTTPSSVPGTDECRYADFGVSVSANVIVPSKPTKRGWTTSVPGGKIQGTAAVQSACGSKGLVPVRIVGKPDHQTVFDWIEANEQEHIDDLEKVKKAHLDKYFREMLALRASDPDRAKCAEKLNIALGNKHPFAARDFLDDWLDSLKKRDKGGGHQLKNKINVRPYCKSIKIKSRPK